MGSPAAMISRPAPKGTRRPAPRLIVLHQPRFRPLAVRPVTSRSGGPEVLHNNATCSTCSREHGRAAPSNLSKGFRWIDLPSRRPSGPGVRTLIDRIYDQARRGTSARWPARPDCLTYCLSTSLHVHLPHSPAPCPSGTPAFLTGSCPAASTQVGSKSTPRAGCRSAFSFSAGSQRRDWPTAWWPDAVSGFPMTSRQADLTCTFNSGWFRSPRSSAIFDTSSTSNRR